MNHTSQKQHQLTYDRTVQPPSIEIFI